MPRLWIDCIWFHLLIKSSSTLTCPPAEFLQMNFLKKSELKFSTCSESPDQYFQEQTSPQVQALRPSRPEAHHQCLWKFFRMIMVMMKTEPAGQGKVHRINSIIGEWFLLFQGCCIMMVVYPMSRWCFKLLTLWNLRF